MSTSNSESGDEIRHNSATCHHLLFMVRRGGIEIMCKCGIKVLYTWRQILLLMLAADRAN